MTLLDKWNDLGTFTKSIVAFWGVAIVISLLACGGGGEGGHDHTDAWEGYVSGDRSADAGRTNPMTCSQMASCKDAVHHFNQVSGDPFDWDKDDDGMPCERTVCGGEQCQIRRTCSDLNTCGEALELMWIDACGKDWHNLDADGDYIPCEQTLCTDQEYQCEVDVDCSHFATFEEAQTYLNGCSGDVHEIDGDGDGVACEYANWNADCGHLSTSYSCADMDSCSQAKAFFHGCDTDQYHLDGDGDGVPCDNLCGNSSAQ